MVWLSLFNHKGGVGKTTTALNLAAYHADQGHYTLLIDADAQGNATKALGYDMNTPGLGEVLAGEAEMADLVKEPIDKEGKPTIPGLYLLPASKDRLIRLFGAEDDESKLQPPRPARAYATLLKKQFDALQARAREQGAAFDMVFMDLPPSFSVLTHLGLIAADGVLVPLQANRFSVDGLIEILREVETKKKGSNPGLKLAGAVIVQYRKNESQQHYITELRAIKQTFKDKLFNSIVPLSQSVADAVDFGKPAVIYDRGGEGAKGYRRVYAELMETLRKEFNHGPR